MAVTLHAKRVLWAINQRTSILIFKTRMSTTTQRERLTYFSFYNYKRDVQRIEIIKAGA